MKRTEWRGRPHSGRFTTIYVGDSQGSTEHTAHAHGEDSSRAAVAGSMLRFLSTKEDDVLPERLG